MARAMERACTIFVATYNRPTMLAQQLHYLSSAGYDGPVHVLDSSDVEQAQHNALVASAYPRFVYRHLPSTTPVFSKFAEAFSQAETPYSVLLPDDDFLLVSRLSDIIAALEADQDAAAAHGHYFEYHRQGKSVRVTSLIQSGAHLNQSAAANRVVALMASYEALTYAVCRTEKAKTAFAEAAKQESILAQELLSGTGIAALGKVIRLDFLTHGRRSGSTLGYRKWHPMEWSVVDPAGLFAAYGPYRTALLDIIANHEPDVDLETAKRQIDLGHLTYLSHYLDPEVLIDAAARDPNTMGASGVVESAWDVWAAGRGPAWARPFRTGNIASRLLRRMVVRSGLRYKLPRSKQRSQEIYSVADTGTECTVHLERTFFDDPVVAENLLDTASDFKQLSCALAVRESTKGARGTDA